MIPPAELRAIREGSVDLAFRRWERPRVRVGTRLRTAVGLVEVTEVTRVAASRITAAEARRAGAASLTELRARLAEPADRPTYRIGLRHAGADPREMLREQVPDDAERDALRAWLDRLDAAASGGAWTRATLELVHRHPGVRAPDLAASVGRETAEFKRDVRKLKERGLTISLDVGYRLSPRGAAVLGVEPPRVPEGTPLPRIGAPASRALAAAGVTALEQLATWRRQDLLALHGVGPYAVRAIDDALGALGLSFVE